jgi:hypothetical protein
MPDNDVIMTTRYRFTHLIEYTVDAEDEDDAVTQIADLIRRDWIDYLDSGELVCLDG